MIRSSLEDAARIHAAATPDTLWRYLAVNIHARAMPNTFEAMCAFLKLHKDHPANALRTAQLICTDPRWRRLTAPLIVDIEQSAILDEEALDQLADGFLWDDELAWQVPEQWLRSEAEPCAFPTSAARRAGSWSLTGRSVHRCGAGPQRA